MNIPTKGSLRPCCFVEHGHLRHERVFDLDGGHQGEGASVVGPPVHRPPAAHRLAGEGVDHLVRDEDMCPVAFDAVCGAEESVIGAADAGASPAGDRPDFPDVSRGEAAAGTVHHEQSVLILSRLDSPCFAELIKSLVGVVIEGPDVGFVTLELILASIPRPVLALVDLLKGRVLGHRNGRCRHRREQKRQS